MGKQVCFKEMNKIIRGKGFALKGAPVQNAMSRSVLGVETEEMNEIL